MVIVKVLNKLFQGKDLPVIRRAPAKKRYLVYDSLRNESLFNQILKGGMTAPL